MQQRVQSPLDPSMNLVKHNGGHQTMQTHSYATYGFNNNINHSNNNQMNNRSTNNSHKPANSNGISNDLVLNSAVGTGLNNMHLLNGFDDSANPTGIAQNFNQLSKIIAPHPAHHQLNELNGMTNLKELPVGAPAAPNGILVNQNGYTNSNSPQSPPMVKYKFKILRFDSDPSIFLNISTNFSFLLTNF